MMQEPVHKPLDMDALRQAAETKGTWKSLEDLAETEGFQDFLEREFPKHVAPWAEAIDRRHFLKLMGASAALAGLAACRPQVTEKIVPYVHKPEEVEPGIPTFYASSFVLGGYANGILVETHEGRPTKVEGNPGHPGSMGATDIWAQASVLGLYDPDRSQAVLLNGSPSTLSAFYDAARKELAGHVADGGARIRILTETVTSPSLAAQIQAFLAKYPSAKWHAYEPINNDNVYEGTRRAFGKPLEPIYHYDKAKVVVSLDSDFMMIGAGRVRYSWDFANARRVSEDKKEMNRLYVAESTPTVTGSKADHRLAVRSSAIPSLAMALASEIGVPGASAANVPESARTFVHAAAEDLLASRGAAIVVAGQHQPAEVHAIAAAINRFLSAPVSYIEPVQKSTLRQTESLRNLATAMDDAKVDLLLMIGGNPAYSAPGDIDFANLMAKVPMAVHLGTYVDETSMKCRWHVPLAHDLEAWGDAHAYDGTASVIQPTIAPLYGAPSAIEFFEGLLGGKRDGLAIVRSTAARMGVSDEKAWKRALHDGVIAGTASAAVAAQATLSGVTVQEASDDIEVVVEPDSAIYDGSFANNAWLQELPKPLTSLTWDNVFKVSPQTAQSLGITDKIGGTGSDFTVPMIRVEVGGKELVGPALVTPGQADDVLTVSLGFGRTKVGVVGEGIGFDVRNVRTTVSPWIASGASVALTGKGYNLATTQNHYNMQNRHLVRSAPIEEFIKDPHFPSHVEHHGEKLSMYPEREYKGNKWAMVIDTNVCTGCNACVVACQAENNIPVVGKEQVARGREMHWLRIDRYYEGALDAPAIHHIPILCMQCEKAPCEVVCPVAATTHGHEGLNEMVYNRCVGTRYCSNNCPYKVRRFNFRHYSGNVTTKIPAPEQAPVLKLVNNPNVTVRGRGVMEKCTYCVQRISSARKKAKRENREIRDGEVVTACQAACPTKAIVFGNLNDKESAVSKAAAQPHNYSLLKELNTRPRTTYLAKLTNPNAHWSGEAQH